MENKFILFGDYRLDIEQIQAYRIIKGSEVIQTSRIVNIDPTSIEGKKILEEFNAGTTARAIGAGVASGTAGTVGGAAVGLASYIAIGAMTGGAAFAIGGAIAIGSTVLGVKKSLKKSKQKKENILKRNETKEIDSSILEVVLKKSTIEENIEGYTGYSTANYATGATSLKKQTNIQHEKLQFQANKCGFDIYEKCKELDELFGISKKESN